MPKKHNAAGAAGSQQNERFIYQFMFVFVLVMAVVVLLHGVQRFYSYLEYMDLIKLAAGWIACISAVLGIVGLIAAVATGKRVLRWSGALLMLLAACAGCTHLLYTDGVTMSYALVIGAGVLYLAQQIYPNEFVALTGVTGLAAIGYYGISKYSGAMVWNSYTAPIVIVLAVVLLLALGLTALAGKKDGTLVMGCWKLQLWQSKLSQVLLYMACLIWVALLALIFVLGATFAWYCVLVAALVIFVLTVWYTIKLM